MINAPLCFVHADKQQKQADPLDPNWKTSFYGKNYEKLLSIKIRYDPEGVFYAPTAVGSDAWVSQPDGRLCRVSAGKDAESQSKDEL